MSTSQLIKSAARPRSPREAYRRQARARQLRQDVLIVLAWVSVAVVIALFLAQGGAGEFGTTGAALRSIGILLGLVATDLMCLMLLLSARIPFVDRAFGHDRALEMHSKLGKYVIYGLLGHGALLLAGYTLADNVSVLAEWQALWDSRDFRLAVLAFGLLAVVGVSSIVAVKRKFPHEFWHAIHLLTYVSVALAIPHQFSMGGLFRDPGPQRWYWIGLYVLTAFALLTYRVTVPIITTLDQQLVVARVSVEGEGVVSIEMRGRNVPDLEAAAGQFFHWRFLAPGLWWHQHPFSISARPTADTLRITIRALGRGTSQLLALRPGTKVAIEGPYGVFSDKARTTDRVVLVGIGIGIAPIRALLEETDIRPGMATVILRGSTPEQVYLEREIRSIANRRGAKVLTLVGPRATSSEGREHWVPRQYEGRRLWDFAPDVASSDLFVCGPKVAADLVIAEALAAGTPPTQIHYERFSW